MDAKEKKDGYTFIVRIPIESYKKYGIDRDRFLAQVKKRMKEKMPEIEVEVKKGVG